MIRYFAIMIIMILTCCASPTLKEQNKSGNTSDTSDLTQRNILRQNEGLFTDKGNDSIILPGDSSSYSYLKETKMTYFVVIADSSLDYFTLRAKMFDLNNQLNLHIDTFGRTFNKEKNLIALPDSSQDNYAGDYFPRDFPSDNLSLEYLNHYQKQTGEKTIALVAGIYEKEAIADSVLNSLKRIEKKAFKLKADMYISCQQ